MGAAVWTALSPLAGLAVNAATFVLLVRRRPAAGLLRAEYRGFAAGAATVALILALARARGAPGGADGAAHALLSLATYAALGYCHFHFVNLGETARRIRLLWELREAGGVLSHGDLLARYGAREIVERRLARLLGTGQIVRRGDRYFAGGAAVAAMAAVTIRLKVLLLGRETEHDV